MNNATTQAPPALILNELTLRCADADTHVEYARRIGSELGRDTDRMCAAYSYLTRWAIANFGASALPVLDRMNAALDAGRGL